MAANLPAMQGRTCVVTGANSGIGKSLATSFAKAGAHVVMVCRDPRRGQEARQEVLRTAGRSEGVELELCDVGSLASVRAFADRWNATKRPIHVLMNNAGIYLPRRTSSPDGFESMFAINHVGPHVMTNLLLDRLAGARVITTSSVAHTWGRVDVETIADPRLYVAFSVYGNSKLCNVLFTRELARRHGRGGVDDRGIVASCFHPGSVGTGFAQDEAGPLGLGMRIAKFAMLTPDEGADTGLYLATSDDANDAKGEYYVKRKVAWTAPQGRDDGRAEALWRKTSALAGLA